MDDLEEIWGPRGRATVDPGSVRAAGPPAGEVPAAVGDIPAARAPLAPPAAPPLPPPPRSQLGVAAIPGEIVPAGVSTARPPHLVAIVVGTVAVVVAIVALALATRPSERPAPRVTAGSTATTIVSAAADLLGRNKVTTPTEATTTSGETTASTAPPAPATTPTTATPTPAPAAPSRTTPASAADLPPLVLAEDAARQFIDILHRRDCDGLWSMLSRGTQAFLTGSTEPGEPSGRDALCDGLRSEESIPPMQVHGPAEWRGAGAVVPLESEGDVEDLAFVAEDGRWVIDLFGDLGEESSEES